MKNSKETKNNNLMTEVFSAQEAVLLESLSKEDLDSLVNKLQQMQAKLNAQKDNAGVSETHQPQAKKANSEGWAMTLTKLLPLIALPLVILLLLPPPIAFTEVDSENFSDDSPPISRRLS